MTKVQFGIVCALLVGNIAAQLLPILEPARSAPSYEYRIANVKDANFDHDLAIAGDGGWELVFARRAMNGDGPDREAAYEMIFRRVK